MVLHRIVDGVDDIREISGSIRMKRLERQEFGSRGNEVDDSHDHRPVAERRVTSPVHHCGGVLVHHRSRVLVYKSGLASAAPATRRSPKVRHFRAAALIPPELIAL